MEGLTNLHDRPAFLPAYSKATCSPVSSSLPHLLQLPESPLPIQLHRLPFPVYNLWWPVYYTADIHEVSHKSLISSFPWQSAVSVSATCAANILPLEYRPSATSESCVGSRLRTETQPPAGVLSVEGFL